MWATRFLRHLLIVPAFIAMAYSSACKAGGQSGPDPQIITMDVADRAHEVMGFGAQIWSGDMKAGPVLKELGMRYVRMTVGPNWPNVSDKPSADATRNEMDRFLEANFDGDGEPRLANARMSWQMTDRIGVKMVVIQFAAPANWLSTDGENRLLPEYVDDYARYWGSLVALMARNGMRPPYIELSNEPEGDWNTRILPEVYDELVILTRRELDDRGFDDVRIVGPGLAFLDHDDTGRKWVDGLTDEGADALGGWSTHVWDEKFQRDAPPSYIAERWRDFNDAIARHSEGGKKPIFVTEYATAATTFNGVSFAGAESQGSDRVSDTSQFAQRVYEQTLTLVNLGASVLIYWEAADQNWSDHAWGLATGQDGELRRPTFHALSTLLPHIPDQARALRQTWDDPEVTAAGFVGGTRLVIALANGTSQDQTRTLRLDHAPGLRLLRCIAFRNGRVLEPELTLDGHRLTVHLPRESTLTCMFQISPTDAGSENRSSPEE